LFLAARENVRTSPVNPIRSFIDPGQTARDVIGGVPDSARTDDGTFDGSNDSIDEDADPVLSAGYACPSVGDAVDEDVDAVQKVGDSCQKVDDPCQRVRDLLKRVRDCPTAVLRPVRRGRGPFDRSRVSSGEVKPLFG